jgi:hypothetical protein
MCRYRDSCFNRVLAPEGESLSFASPKERDQRKGDPMPLASCALAFLPGFARRDIHVPLAKRGFPAAPLRAFPDKYASARRGIREFSAN